MDTRNKIAGKRASMRYLLIILAGLCILSAGCNPKQHNDPAPLYETVLREEFKREELKGAKTGQGVYVFIDGEDPTPELLKAFQKEWPDLQPGSRAPQRKAIRISIDGLRWIDANTAELRGGWSNGKDGRGSRYRIVRRGNAWIVESAVIDAES